MAVTAQPYVTVEGFRARIGAASGRDDSVIYDAILYASQQINDYCGRGFDRQDDQPRLFRALTPNLCLTDDIIDVASVEVGSAGRSGTFTTLGVDGWYASGHSGHPFTRIHTDLDCAFPSGVGAWVKVTPATYWGWAQVPAPVVAATELQAAKLFTRKDSADAMFALEGVAARRLDTGQDGDAIALLRGYRRRSVNIG